MGFNCKHYNKDYCYHKDEKTTKEECENECEISEKYYEVEATLKVKLKTDFTDNESSPETLRFLVEQVLLDEGFEVESVEVLD